MAVRPLLSSELPAFALSRDYGNAAVCAASGAVISSRIRPQQEYLPRSVEATRGRGGAGLTWVYGAKRQRAEVAQQHCRYSRRPQDLYPRSRSDAGVRRRGQLSGSENSIELRPLRTITQYP